MLASDDAKEYYNSISEVTEMLRTNDLSEGNLSKNRIKFSLVTNYNQDIFDRLQNGEEGTKLRTYKSFKPVIGFQKYLDIIKNKKQRKIIIIMTKFRLSSDDLEIEKGRYGTNSKSEKDRLCQICNKGKVEDEFHFLMQCPFYTEDRLTLMEHIIQILTTHVC